MKPPRGYAIINMWYDLMNYIVDILFLAEIEVLIYLKRQLYSNTYLRFCRCVFSILN